MTCSTSSSRSVCLQHHVSDLQVRETPCMDPLLRCMQAHAAVCTCMWGLGGKQSPSCWTIRSSNAQGTLGRALRA